MPRSSWPTSFPAWAPTSWARSGSRAGSPATRSAACSVSPAAYTEVVSRTSKPACRPTRRPVCARRCSGRTGPRSACASADEVVDSQRLPGRRSAINRTKGAPMLNALQERKLTRMFHGYDINRDGKLEEEDFTAVGRNIAEQRGYSPGSAGHLALANKYREFWGRLSAANGGSGSMVLGEFVAMMDAQ